MTDNLRITIKIADVEPIRFDIKRSEEAIYRRAEYHINKQIGRASCRERVCLYV